MHSQWFLVGAGRCGLQLVRAMRAAGIPVVGVEARSARSRARARRAVPGLAVFSNLRPLPAVEAVLVAVPDSAIAQCAESLARRIGPFTSIAIHTSGIVGAAALGPLAAVGCSIASLHPLVSFPAATGAPVPLARVAAAVEGQTAAVKEAERLARALGMRPFRLSAAAKPRYHAAAALAANMTHVLVATARALLVQAGLPPRLAVAALRSLVSGSVEAALSARGLEKLTGPIARADAPAVLADLRALPRPARSAYRAVASLAVAGLTEHGLVNAKQARRLLSALTSQS